MMRRIGLAVLALACAAANAEEAETEADPNSPAPARAAGVVVGPWVTYPNPGEVLIRWETDTPTVTKLDHWTANRVAESVLSEELTTEHSVSLADVPTNTVHYYTVGTAVDGLSSISEPYDFDSTFNYAPALIDADAAMPGAVEHAALLAEAIVGETSSTRGYALIINDAGQIALEVAKASGFSVTALSMDDGAVQAGREALQTLGVYGDRVRVRAVNDLADTALTPRFANVVVWNTDGADDGAIRAEVMRVLHPYGVAFIGSLRANEWEVVHGEPMPGAGAMDAPVRRSCEHV